MPHDLSSRGDIEKTVVNFYDKVQKDALLAPIFNSVITDWEKHLPTMFSFWETLLFAKMAYKGNPLLKHAVLNKKFSLTQTHFNRWVFLWEQTLDEYFRGPKCEEAKRKAYQISAVMQRHFVQQP